MRARARFVKKVGSRAFFWILDIQNDKKTATVNQKPRPRAHTHFLLTRIELFQKRNFLFLPNARIESHNQRKENKLTLENRAPLHRRSRPP